MRHSLGESLHEGLIMKMDQWQTVVKEEQRMKTEELARMKEE